MLQKLPVCSFLKLYVISSVLKEMLRSKVKGFGLIRENVEHNSKSVGIFATYVALYGLSIPLLSTLTKLLLTSPFGGMTAFPPKSLKVQCIVI